MYTPVALSPPFFERFLEVLFCQECQAISTFRPGYPQLYKTGGRSDSISFLEIGRSHKCQIMGVRLVGDDSHLVFRQKLLGKDGSVRRSVVMVKQPGLFSLKFGATSSHVFAQSPQNVTVKPGIHNLASWNRCFVLPQTSAVWMEAPVPNISDTTSY
jgi:hypothetical protein